MKKSFLLLMLFIGTFSFSQIRFEKGYFITNSDERVECLIRNMDWKSSPDSFEYKINEEDEALINDLKDLKLFEIYDQVKYVRSDVKLDQSSSNLNLISSSREPDFTDRQLFLKELISGNVSLYEYTDGNLTRFFYQTKDGNIEPLIYKIYESEGGKIAYNEDYKKQLEDILVCSSISPREINRVEYKENPLTDLFVKYYQCSDANYEEISVVRKKGKFNLYLRPRISSSSAEFENEPANNQYYDMGNKIGFGLGVEMEYILPFNKNKWAILAEPTYQYYKSKKTVDSDGVVGGKHITDVNYQSIEIPIGIRHYMFINDQSKLFINLQYVFDLAMDSKIEFKRKDDSILNSLDIKAKPNIAIGFGYNYNNKYSIEARFFTNRDLTADYAAWISKYKTISLIFAYNIF